VQVFVVASGVGVYPHGPDRSGPDCTEATPAGEDFMARLVLAWEAAAALPTHGPTRVVTMRTGVVLGRDGGALAQMLWPFRLVRKRDTASRPHSKADCTGGTRPGLGRAHRQWEASLPLGPH
jgi:NAD dependent epimerase/dehydratase family enzyme